MTSLIDAHVHVWSPDRNRYPLAPGFEDGDLWLPSCTPHEHEAVAGSAVPLNLVQMTWYGLDHGYILDLIDSDPDRFTGTGIVPAICDVSLPRPERTMRELAKGGIRCFRLRGRATQPHREHPGEHWLAHESYERMFACAAEHQLTLSFLCAPADLAELGHMCALFPETRVLLDHCGGVRIRNHTIDTGELRELMSLSELPEVRVKFGPIHGLGDDGSPFSDTLQLLRELTDAYGAERILWESDLGGPLQMSDPEHDFRACVDLVEHHADFLTTKQRQQILGGNARRLLWSG